MQEMLIPNEHGVIVGGTEEIVARRGRSYAEVCIAYCEDGLYRIGTSFQYSYGGHGGPIFSSARGYARFTDARVAGLEELLRIWPKGNCGEPQSVLLELAELREQVASQLRQPALF